METIETTTLLSAVGTYAGTIKATEIDESVHRELYRFVEWYGAEKVFSQISPSEVGAYAEHIAGTGTSPQANERLQVVRKFLSYAKKKGLIETNLAQHVRIRKAKTRAKGSQIKKGRDFVELTPEGHAQLVSQLEKLKGERGPLAGQIRAAAADKDVRENAPLEAVREQLGLIESRIREMENTLRISVIVDPALQTKGKKIPIKIGMKVSVKDLANGKSTSYRLVSATEANPLEGRISDASPLGQAIVGRLEGHEVESDTPRGTLRYLITKVSA